MMPFEAPPALAYAVVAALGACVGSFLNVCVHRLPLRLSIVTPPSSCPGCAQAIAWHDNVPIVSFLLLRGRCRRCGMGIAWRYPALEAATALLFVALFAAHGPTLLFATHAALGSALLALMVIDARHRILPDAITLPGIAAGLVLNLVAGGPLLLKDAAAGAALGFGSLWSINALYRLWQALQGMPRSARQDGIGRGDFKLLAMIGAFLGVRMVVFTLFVGALSGAVFGLFMMRFRGYGWKSQLPYGVFLGGAAILALFCGEASIRLYLASIGIGP